MKPDKHVVNAKLPLPSNLITLEYGVQSVIDAGVITLTVLYRLKKARTSPV